ncbi:hypothetical protein TRFO_37056 [Tritrichomonas foetus]|uniref:Uncharacterized protein n=1 Tax=Tritrichomonas foetus TaxID=1144522 RepID=A0A1J4JC29_9EUKA|nr:hypothetical protein TRFO_37056 [Tritrichomonas foetus]|eukprot:OHS96742.1 hypothetical protein TRFO_37056 [Tritrichomonas foetus]
MKRRKQGSEEPTSSSKSLNENEKSHQLNSKSGLVIFPLFTAIWPKLIRNNSFYKYPHDGTIVYSSFASAVIYLANVVLAKSKISMEDIYNNIYGSWIQRKDGFFLQINPANYDFLWKSFENELKKQQWNIIIKTKYVYVLNQSIKSMNNHYIFFSDQNMTLPHKIYQIIKNNLDYGNKITFTELFEKLICQNYQCPNGQRYCITESDRNRIYRYILWLPFIEKEVISYSVNQCNTDKIKDYRITKIYEPVPCKSLPADLLTKIITIINQCDPFQCGMTLSEIISEISLYENQCSSSEVEEVLNSNPLFFNYHGYYGIRPAIEFTSEECEIQVTEKDVSFIELLYYTVLQNQPISYQVICKKMNNQYFYVNKNKCLITIDYMNKIKKQLKKMPFFLQTPEDDYFVFPKACECDFYGRLYANVIDNYNGRSFDSLRVQYSPIEAIFSCCLAKRDKKSVENSSIETKKLTSNESIIHSSLNIPIPENFHEYQDLFIGKTFVEMKNLVKIPIFEGNPPLSPSEQLFAFAIFARCGKKSEKYFSPETIASYLSGETITVGQRTVVFDNENDYSVCQIVEIVLKRSQYFVIKEKENPLDSDQYSIYMKINETSSSINYAYPSFKDLLIKVLDSLHRSENRFNPNFTLAEISDKMESQKYLISKNKVETFHNENQVANLMIQTYLGMPDFIIKNDHYGLKNWCQSVNHKPPAKPRSRITPIIQLLKKDEILRSYDETTNTFGGRSTNFGKTIKYSKIFNEKRNQVNINLMDETHFHCKVIDDRQSFSKVNNVKNVKENLKNHDNFTLNKAYQSNISSFFVKESINFQTGLTNDFCKENVEKKYVDQNTENDDTTKSPDEVLEEENILVKTMKNLSNKPYYSNQQTENKSHNRYAKFIGILADPTKRQIECDKLFSKNGITKEKLRNYQKKSFLKKRGRPRLHSCDSDDSDDDYKDEVDCEEFFKKELRKIRLN